MKLRDWMMENDVRQGAFAEEIGISQAALSMLCTGRRRPSAEMMYAIAIATKGKVMPNDFFIFDFVENPERRAA